MGQPKEKGNTGKRYTDAQKKKVVDFVASQGRGGIAAAQKKFGVSYIALRRWMNSSGKATKANTAHPSAKAPDIQREVKRQLKISLKALAKAL